MMCCKNKNSCSIKIYFYSTKTNLYSIEYFIVSRYQNLFLKCKISETRLVETACIYIFDGFNWYTVQASMKCHARMLGRNTKQLSLQNQKHTRVNKW